MALTLFPDATVAEIGARFKELSRAGVREIISLCLELEAPHAEAVLRAGATDVLAVPEGLPFLFSRVSAANDRLRRFADANQLADRALAESEKTLRSVIDCATDVIFIKDLDGRYLHMNPAGAFLLGMKQEMIIGCTDEQVFGVEVGRGVRERDQPALDRGAPYVFEQDLELIGKLRTLSTCKAPWLGADGALRGIIGVSRDVTDRKQLEERLMLADRLSSLGTLAASVGHELNNPLAWLTANLTWVSDLLRGLRPALQQAGADVDEVQCAMSESVEGAARISAIVRDLKSFSRGEEGKFEPVDLQAALEAAVRMAHGQLHQRVEIVREYGQVPLAQGNLARLGQVFLNLIVNAPRRCRRSASRTAPSGCAPGLPTDASWSRCATTVRA